MDRALYSASIQAFMAHTDDEILGILTRKSSFAVTPEQRDAWLAQLAILRSVLSGRVGGLYLEFAIPRMGRRVDALLVIGAALLVLEFKVGQDEFLAHDLDQVTDYALDLKHFHESSHGKMIAPILIPTSATRAVPAVPSRRPDDGLLPPIRVTASQLGEVITRIVELSGGPNIDIPLWEQGRYCPTPTIVEAATALYGGHSVNDISRSDASAMNLTATSDAVSKIIEDSRQNGRKSICFVTGVPGAGKTLIGLNIATKYMDPEADNYSVYLSGNGPLVSILREALARDRVRREREEGRWTTKSKVQSKVKAFIQNVHNFRDECLIDSSNPPREHVALFDEAQRAWNKEQTSKFMLRKKKRPNFQISEPEFLLSCMDRHEDWAVVVCLVGGGQEIHTGEAGIGEWIDALNRSFPEWRTFISPQLNDTEFGAGQALAKLGGRDHVVHEEALHLAVSMRSFRSEKVSQLVKQLLDLEQREARRTLEQIGNNYPIVLTRDLSRAKEWLKRKAKGSERYGIIVSSQAERLKPHAIDVRSPMDPIHWFLDTKSDTRSSYYLEDVATEFHVQGLELDWACVTWDADFRLAPKGWDHFSFCGDQWTRIKKEERRTYQKNAYRVLLTRARQGMVIVVPQGDWEDQTRKPEFYDPVYQYLREIGFETI